MTLFTLRTGETAPGGSRSRLANNVLNECEYRSAGHSVLARMSGVAPAAIEALRLGTPIADARLQALRLFAETVVRERGFVAGAAVDAFLAAGFTKAHVLEVVTIIVTKTISNCVSHIAGTLLDAFMAATKRVAPRNRAAAA